MQEVTRGAREEMLTAQEAADYLRISYWTVLKKARKGEIPSVKIGSRVLFSLKILRQWTYEKSFECRTPADTYGKIRKID